MEKNQGVHCTQYVHINPNNTVFTYVRVSVVRIFVLHNTIKGDKIFWDESSFTFSVKGHVKHVSVKKDGATAVYLYSTFEGKLLNAHASAT